MTIAALAASPSLSGWGLHDEAWLLDDATLFDTDGGALHVDEAYVFRVQQPDGADGGWVVVGAALAAHTAGHDMQARALANRLAVVGASPEEVTEAAAGTWTVPVDRAVLLGALPLPSEAVRVTEEQGVRMTKGPLGREEVMVTALPALGAARRAAMDALLDRTTRWASEALQPTAPTLLDRLQGAEPATVEQPGRLLAGLRLHRDAPQPAHGDRWLTYTHDPSGVMLTGDASRLRAGAARDLLLSTPLPPTPTGRAGAPDRWALQGAGVTALAKVEPGGQAATLAITADLQLVPQGTTSRLLVLDVPHTEQRGYYDNPNLPNGFELVDITVDGVSLPTTLVPLTADQTEGRGAWRTVAVVLPTDTVDDELTLRVRWRDRRRYGHIMKVTHGPAEAYVQLDVSTGVVPVMPRVRGHDGHAAPVQLRAGVSAEGMADTVIASGDERARSPQGRVEWVHADTTSTAAYMAAGDFRTSVVEGRHGLPAIAAYVHVRADAQREASRLAQVAELIDPVIPHWPDRVQALTARSTFQQAPTVAPFGGGMLQLSPTTLSVETPPVFPAASFYAAGLALDRWFEQELSGEAAEVALLGGNLVGWWSLQAMGSEQAQRRWSEVLGAEARAGRHDVARWPHQVARRLELAAHALPEAFGEHAVRQAFTEVLAGTYPTTWEGVAQALEDASGIEADGWVTLWLASDVRPTLDLRWRHDVHRGAVLARIDTDAPYGSMPLLVTAHDGRVQRAVPVSLHDGVAQVVLPWPGQTPPRRLTVDAGHHPVRINTGG